MIDNFFFWKDWHPAYRRLFVLALLVGITALVIYFVHYFTGIHGVIHWETSNELRDLPLALDTFTSGLFNFTVEASTYVVLEQFLASTMQVPLTANYGYGLLLACGIVLLLGVLPALPRLYYLAGMGAFILFLATCKLDVLRVFGWTNDAVFISMVGLYGGLSYYFHAFNKKVTLPARIGCFALLTTLLVGGILYFSQTSQPVLSLTTYGIIFPIVLSVVFFITIAHEIPNGLLYVVSQASGRSSNGMMHFTITTFIYLGNVLLAYLHNSRAVDWDLLYVNAFYLLPVSALIGLWGYRQRSPLVANILPFVPNGAFLYVALVIIAAATIGYSFASANDPLIEMFEDAIIYSHLAMGAAFYLYVFINFRQLFNQGLAVHKVVYQPRRLDFFLARGLALLIMMALLFKSNMYPFYQSISGYYNGLGDLATAQNELFLAEQYYKLGTEYDFQNHKSNYAAASLARQQNDSPAAVYYLKQAMLNKPTPYAYVSLSNLYRQEGLFFEALFNLQQGARQFPESGEVLNNLALLYHQSNVLDSAFIYFDLANQYAGRPEVAQTNLLAVYVKSPALAPPDSLVRETVNETYLSLQNNRLVLASLNQRTDSLPLSPVLIQDSVLTRERFAYLYNYALNHRWQPDTLLTKQLRKYEVQEINGVFAEDVRFARTCAEYYGNDRRTAFDLLSVQATESSGRKAYFSKTLGLWLMQQQAYQQAASPFAEAVQAGDSTLLFNHALALSEAGNWPVATQIWQQLRTHPNPETRLTATQMLAVVNSMRAPALDTSKLGDAEKTLLVRFGDLPNVAALPGAIQNADYRALAFMELARKYLLAKQIPQAVSALNQGKSVPSVSQSTRKHLNKQYLALLAAQGKFEQAIAEASRLSVDAQTNDKLTYWRAKACEQTNDLRRAEQLYERAIKRLPMEVDVVMGVSRFFNAKLKSPERAYNVLLTAIQLDPYSVPLQQAYALQCVEMGLSTYAEQALANLREITTLAGYQAFLPEYEAKKASVEKRMFGWE